MNKMVKYENRHYIAMKPNSKPSIEQVFTNPDYLYIMYSLAKLNPNITMKLITKDTKLNSQTVEDALAAMQFLQLVFKSKEQGYTLTESGLASLYIFDKEFMS